MKIEMVGERDSNFSLETIMCAGFNTAALTGENFLEPYV